MLQKKSHLDVGPSNNQLYFTFYFFLPLVPIGVAGGHSCLSAARRVAWSRDIPWVLRVSATESLHRFLGLPLVLQPEYLVLYARRAGWFIGIRVMCPNHLTCCCLMCCRTATTSRRWNSPQMLEMDWTHPPKVNDLCDMSSPDLEPKGKETARPPKKHLLPRSGGWDKESGLHLGTTWETGLGWACLDSSCRRPVVQYGPKAMTMMMMMMMTMMMMITWETGPGWACLDSSCRRPMVQYGPKAMTMMTMMMMMMMITWKTGPGWACLDSSCRRPMVQYGPKAMTMMMMMMMMITWKTGPGWACLDSSCRRPMVQYGPKAMTMMMMMMMITWKTGPGWGCLESCCRCPIHQQEPKTEMMSWMLVFYAQSTSTVTSRRWLQRAQLSDSLSTYK